MLKPEKISYPELGQIMPGDYYAALPFDQYIDKNQPLPSGKNVFDIRDFGAQPGEMLNTEPLQLACEACRDAGGGTVLVAGGSYRTGTVRLYDNTTLFITGDSELVASRNADDLIQRIEGTQDFGEESSGGAFILAVDARNITLTGGGRVCGSGEWFVYPARQKPALTPFDTTMLPTRAQVNEINTVPGSVRTWYRERIRYAEDKYGESKPVLRRPSFMVWLLRCQDIRVENIILHDSMCWTLHLEACDRALIRHTVIDDNRHVANTDGIDLSGCTEVEVDHCFISCADDGLCVKNPVFTNRASSHLRLHDCTVITVMSAFKIGTGTRHDISDVTVEDCVFEMPDIYPGTVTGISIESCDGSHVKGITVRNITMKKVQCPLYIVLNRRNQAREPFTEELSAPYWGGAISGVTIENIRAEEAELPAILTGYADMTPGGKPVRKAISDIKVRDYVVTYRQNKEILHIPEQFDEFLTDYPESNAHGDVDACGLWVRHADGVTLEGVQVTPRKGNTRDIIRMHDVR